MSELSPELDVASTMFSGDLALSRHIKAAAQHIASGEVVAIDNDSVWALWGNAADSRYVDTVRRIKGRDPNSRFGLTLPFQAVTQYANLDLIHPKLRALFEKPDTLTGLLGSLAFVRFPVRPDLIAGSLLESTVLSQDTQGRPLLQNYDPAGKKNVQMMVEEAMSLGVQLPAASSMNVSGNAEIMEMADAAEFVRDHALNNAYHDSNASRLGTGSYLILEATASGFCMLREGNISNDIVRRLLDGLPFDISPLCKRALGRPMTGLEGYVGADLRKAIIEARHWDT